MASLHLCMGLAKRHPSDTIDVLWNSQSRYFILEEVKLRMNTKTISYVVALVGLVAVGLGVYWDFVKHDHPTRGLYTLILGAVLIIAGLVGAFMMKPKAAVA